MKCFCSKRPKNVSLLLAVLQIYYIFQSKREAANMFYTCGPNEAMVVSGKMMILTHCKVAS